MCIYIYITQYKRTDKCIEGWQLSIISPSMREIPMSVLCEREEEEEEAVLVLAETTARAAAAACIISALTVLKRDKEIKR